MNTRLSPWPYPRWIAHRGAGTLAPENTLAAFQVGASHGYRAFECDVKLSADGVPFLLHDDTLQRTTSAQGLAGQRTWSDLAQLDAGSWHSDAYAGEPVPSFESIALYVLRNRFALNVEIKPTPELGHETGRMVARDAARLWAAHAGGEVVRPLLSSFQVEALAGAREAVSDLPRALLLDGLRPGWLEQAHALACVAVVMDLGLIDAQVVALLHEADMRVLAYTVNDLAQADRLLRLGVDCLITDAVDRLGV